MLITRRGFARGSLSLAVAQVAAPALCQNSDRSSALTAIGAYGLAHLQHFGLPGLTLGVTTGDGLSTVMDFGYANPGTGVKISPGTLFQIGSISKLVTSAILHQFAAEDRLSLNDRVSALLPAIPLPPGNAIEIQHLLDHSAGIASDVPVFPDGGLWTAYPPGQHWHYSNTGYEILGLVIEHLGEKPLAQIVQERIFSPLGMRRSLGAILAKDRSQYAQGFEVIDELPFAIGVPLAPSAWVDTSSAAVNIASTASDMNLLLRSLAGAAGGKGGLGLTPLAARIDTRHAVPSDERGMSYGNGLMHVYSGNRAYLHHTGGMVSFSSSFHLDVVSGAGAFASATISAFAQYRPKLLTEFAVQALTNAGLGRPLPVPPSLEIPIANAAAYAARYSGPAGSLEVKVGAPLAIEAGGQRASLQPQGADLFTTTHPAFREFSLMFERNGSSVTAVSFGPSTYLRVGSAAKLPASDPDLAKLAGRYSNDNPWLGFAHVVERGGRLWLGTEIPMEGTGTNLWRIGDEPWSPERGSFMDFVDGRPQTFIFSGARFSRQDV